MNKLKKIPKDISVQKNSEIDYVLLAKEIRKTVLRLIYETKSPHIGSSFSIVEILTALYFRVLNISPENKTSSTRDRFILSKGHACSSLYTVLAERGFLSKKELDGFAVNGGTLEHHPTMDLSRGIEVSTGSLGHGLSIGAGMALAGRADHEGYRVYVLMSDGELNEGSTWEAIMFSGHHKLNNLVALIDYNKMQALGHTRDILELEPLGDKWRSFGWHVQEIDGHDFDQIFKSLDSMVTNRPNAIILHTIKGKGVSFMENKLLWHYRTPDEREYRLALKELAS